MPVSKSWLQRDAVSKIGTQLASSEGAFSEHRQELLNFLERFLSKEEKLALETDAYQRSHGPNLLGELSEQLPLANLSLKRRRPDDAMAPKSVKKRKSDDTTSKEPSKRKNKDKVPMNSTRSQLNTDSSQLENQRSIVDAFKSAPVPTPKGCFDAATQPVKFDSFKSTNSPPPPRIFSPSPQDGQTSSNDTSILSLDEAPSTQYGLGTQEFNEIYQEPSFTESLHAAENENLDDTKRILQDLVNDGPCRKPSTSQSLPRRTPFRYRYECHRLAKKAFISPRHFFKAITVICKTEEPTFAAFWDAAKLICNNAAPDSQLLASDKSSQVAWDHALDNFTTLSHDKSVALSAVLDWAEASQKGVFNLTLKPLRLEKSCRFDRRFGGDRLLCVTIPDLSGSSMPQHMKPKAKNIHSAVSHWLGRETHYIAGRYWRAYYVEPTKTKPNSTASPTFRVYMFAVGGVDMSEATSQDRYLGGRRSDCRTKISLPDFIDWYMPIQANLGSSDTKLFQRFRLGLSRTWPTAVLDPEEFVLLKDNPDWNECMNDGCARMSRELANEVSRQLGLDDKPSASNLRGQRPVDCGRQ